MTATTYNPTQTVDLADIREVANVRQSLGDVRQLAASIEAVGLLNPLTVRRINAADEAVPLGGAFELLSGHRRKAALETLGVKTAPVYIVERSGAGDDADRLATQLVENLQREDLNPIEEAEGLADLVDLVGSQKEAAELIGRSPAYLSKRLKLRTLPDEGKAAVSSGALSLEDAFDVAKLQPKRQREVLKQYGSGIHPETARRHLDSAIADTVKDGEARKAARAVAGQKHRKGIEVVAVPDRPKAWQSIEGYNGLTIDQDAHEAEPCHRLVVGYQASWDTEIREAFYCADAGRHDPDGESALKLTETTADADRAKREKDREKATRKAEKKAAKLHGEAVDLAANLTDRNVALKVLSRYVLDLDVMGDSIASALAAVGVELPEEPAEYDPEDPTGYHEDHQRYAAELAEKVDGLSVAKLYRAAVFEVLASTVKSTYNQDEATSRAIAEFLGIE